MKVLAHDALGVLHRHATLTGGDPDDADDDSQGDDDEADDGRQIHGGKLSGAPGDARYDADEDHDGHAVADASGSDELGEPHHEHGAGDEAGDDEGAAPQVQVGQCTLTLEQHQVAQRLDQGQPDGEPARVLGDLLLPLLALFGELLELGDDHGEQLHDDRRRDVRHDAQSEQRDALQRPPGEQVEETHDAAAARFEELLQGGEVDAGHRHVRTKTINGDHRRREDDLGAKVRDLPRVDERLPQLVVHSCVPPVRIVRATRLCRRRPRASRRRCANTGACAR